MSDDPDNRRQPGDAAASVEHALIEDHRELLAFLQRRLGCREDAEEALQNFMLRAIERAATLRDVHTLRGWLSRLLATSIADKRRAAVAKHRREVSLDTAPPEALQQEEAEADGAVCLCLHQLLPTLRPDYAQIIRRVDLEEERRSVVAEDLKITPNNLSVRLLRARQALRRRLEEFCLTCPEHGFLDCGCDHAAFMRKLTDLVATKKNSDLEATKSDERSAR